MITYGQSQEAIIKRGLEAIKEVLCGTDSNEKASLLLCLEKYLDPYFNLRLPFEAEIYTLLEQVVISSDSVSIKEDALHLLTLYARASISRFGRKFREDRTGANARCV